MEKKKGNKEDGMVLEGGMTKKRGITRGGKGGEMRARGIEMEREGGL